MDTPADGLDGRQPTERVTVARLGRVLASLLFGVAVLAGAGLVTAPAADAAVPYCEIDRCTLYLSKSETLAVAEGRVPAPPSGLPWQLRVAYYGAAWGHQWFAGQYAAWGYCSGFSLSIYPWESQGYFGYACDWN